MIFKDKTRLELLCSQFSSLKRLIFHLQVENSVKTSPKNKRMWVTFLIIVFFLIGALGKAHEKHLAAKERNFSQNWKVIRPGLEALLSCSCLMLFYYYASLVFSFVCSFFVSWYMSLLGELVLWFCLCSKVCVVLCNGVA